MEKKGYKSFKKRLVNHFGKEFELNKEYSVSGEIKFGNSGNGYHFAERPEDTLRYFLNEDDVIIAEVTGRGKIVESYDDYNGYYDLYSAEKITIDRIIERKELILMFLEMGSNIRVERFLKSYHLTEEEINLFKKKFEKNLSIKDIIAFYQEGDKDVYQRRQYEYKKTGE